MRYIDANIFHKLCEQYPAIIYPAVELKKYLREKILGLLILLLFIFICLLINYIYNNLGPRFWKPLCEYREKFYEEHSSTSIAYIPVRVLLIYPQDSQAIVKYIEKRENINPLRIATLRSVFYFFFWENFFNLLTNFIRYTNRNMSALNDQ